MEKKLEKLEERVNSLFTWLKAAGIALGVLASAGILGWFQFHSAKDALVETTAELKASSEKVAELIAKVDQQEEEWTKLQGSFDVLRNQAITSFQTEATAQVAELIEDFRMQSRTISEQIMAENSGLIKAEVLQLLAAGVPLVTTEVIRIGSDKDTASELVQSVGGVTTVTARIFRVIDNKGEIVGHLSGVTDLGGAIELESPFSKSAHSIGFSITGNPFHIIRGSGGLVEKVVSD